MRVKEQEINQLRVKVQKQKMELHRANIEIDYLLQARDAVISREQFGRLKNKSFFYPVVYFIVI